MFSMPLRSLAVEKMSPLDISEQRGHESFRRAEELDARERDVIQMVLAALFDGDGDVGAVPIWLGWIGADVQALSAHLAHASRWSPSRAR